MVQFLAKDANVCDEQYFAANGRAQQLLFVNPSHHGHSFSLATCNKQQSKAFFLLALEPACHFFKSDVDVWPTVRSVTLDAVVNAFTNSNFNDTCRAYDSAKRETLVVVLRSSSGSE